MLISLIVYIVGALVSGAVLHTDCAEDKQLGTKERCKVFFGTIVAALLWPVAGAVFLWELLDVWRTMLGERGER